MDYTAKDRRFAYIYKDGGTCIDCRELLPAEKLHLLNCAEPDGEHKEWMKAHAWWCKENIRAHREMSRKANGSLVDERLIDLHDKLLSFAGNETCLPTVEEDLEKILSRGQVWLGDRVDMMKGRPCQCHSNSCELYELNKDLAELAIATGYALSKDGLWRQHSWLVKRNTRSVRVIETTTRRILYFGFIMSDEEAAEFCEFNP